MDLWLLIIFIGILCVIGLIATILVIKQEENNMKRYTEEGGTPEEELKRSLEYETKSLSSNAKSLFWIYVIAIGASLIGFAIYVYLR